jgi:hypothetical protein
MAITPPETAVFPLAVTGPDDAAAALAAAGGIRLFDLRSGAWASGVCSAYLGALASVTLASPSSEGAAPYLPLTVFTGLIGVIGLTSLWWERRIAALPRVQWQWLVAVGAVWCAVAVGTGLVGFAGWVPYALLLPWAIAPTVSGWRGRRRPPPAWPAGSEPFAMLSVLHRAVWVHPDRLAALAGLPRPVADGWVGYLARWGLATPESRLGPWSASTRITPSGRAVLGYWRADLEDQSQRTA